MDRTRQSDGSRLGTTPATPVAGQGREPAAEPVAACRVVGEREEGTMTLRLHNLDRGQSAALGGIPSEHDHCIIVNLTVSTCHPLTGEITHPTVYAGTLAECRAWMQREEG